MSTNPLEVPQAPQDDKKDVPVAEAKAEGQKMEWGPELDGRMSLDDAEKKIYALNTKLAKGEMRWRLPTRYELVSEFKKTNSTPAGFKPNYYWSSTTHPEFSNLSFYVNMGGGMVDFDYEKNDPYNFVRLVRDVA